MKRVVLSGLLAGIVLFFWLSVLHLATPLAQVGIRALPNEQEMVETIKNGVPEEGFYMFPGAKTREGASKAEKQAAMNAAMEKMKTTPTGIMVVFPKGKTPLAPRQLAIEFLNDLVQGLLLAWLLSRSTMTAIGDKLKFALAVGVAAAFVTNISYWNWYGFPTDYTLAYLFSEVSGYLVMGAAIALVTSKQTSTSANELRMANAD